MNQVLLRRLLGALVLLFGVFLLSLVLPPPTGPKPAEPGMQRVELAVDEGIASVKTPGGADLDADGVPSAPGDDDTGDRTDDAAAVRREPVAAAPQLRLDTHLAADRDSADSAKAPAEKAAKAGVTPRLKSEAQLEARAPASKTGHLPDSPPAARPDAKVPARSAAKAEAKPDAKLELAPPARPATKPDLPPPAKPAVRTSSETAKRDEPKAAATPEPNVSVPKAATSGATPWRVQAGSYADIANAREVEAKLKLIGLTATLSVTESGGGVRYRVRSGPYATRDAADKARQRMQQNGIAASVIADGR